MDGAAYLNWERIQSSFISSTSRHDDTYRVRILGGWLVRYVYTGGAGKTASVITFIADAKDKWNIGKNKAVWQPIDSKRNPNSDLKIFRMKVPGGWIVREGYYVSSRYSNDFKIEHLSESMTFVPDKKHTWTLHNDEQAGNERCMRKST